MCTCIYYVRWRVTKDGDDDHDDGFCRSEANYSNARV